MNILKQIKDTLCNQGTPLENFLGTEPFNPETDYKIEKCEPLAYDLGENNPLSNDDIKEAIHQAPNMIEELEMKQMSQTDFYQLSYEDCLPVQESSLKRTRINRKQNVGRK